MQPWTYRSPAGKEIESRYGLEWGWKRERERGVNLTGGAGGPGRRRRHRRLEAPASLSSGGPLDGRGVREAMGVEARARASGWPLRAAAQASGRPLGRRRGRRESHRGCGACGWEEPLGGAAGVGRGPGGSSGCGRRRGLASPDRVLVSFISNCGTTVL